MSSSVPLRAPWLLTRRQAAALIGSHEALTRLIAGGEISTVKVDGQTRIPAGALGAYVAGLRRAAARREQPTPLDQWRTDLLLRLEAIENTLAKLPTA